MIKHLQLILLILLFSCSKIDSNIIYQGKIEELIVGDFSLQKDSLTMGIYNVRVVKEGKSELILTTKSAIQFNGWAFVFSDPSTGLEVDRVEIPTEGPESMKGGILANIVQSKDQIFLLNHLGEIGEYNQDGRQVRFFSYLKDYADSKEKDRLLLNSDAGLGFYRGSSIQLGLNPNTMINLQENPAPGEMKSEFPVDFKGWIISINLERGEVLKSNFLIPGGYENFKNDFTATQMFGTLDSKRGKFYLGWPSSKEVYVLNGVNLIEKITPESNIEFNFLPTEVIPWGDRFTVWDLPKESSRNIFLLYDEVNDLILKCSKINESGSGETKFDRTKHYVLSVYSGDWNPLGEYNFDFESELDLENWFLTSEGLFINKPEQKSEDEYEFYKIDLAQFAD